MRVDEIIDQSARSIANADIDPEYGTVQTVAQALVQLGYPSAKLLDGGESGSLWEVGMGRKLSGFVKTQNEVMNSNANNLGQLERDLFRHQAEIDAGNVVLLTGAVAGILNIK